MAEKINEICSPNTFSTSVEYNKILSGFSMGCLLLGRMSSQIVTESTTRFYFLNPLLLKPELDLPTKHTTYIAYADTKDRVVKVSGISREKSKMSRACLNKRDGRDIVMLPLHGEPCRGDSWLSNPLSLVVGKNHLCFDKLLIENILSVNQQTAGGGAEEPEPEYHLNEHGDVCVIIPPVLVFNEEDLQNLEAANNVPYQSLLTEGTVGDDHTTHNPVSGGSPGPSNGLSSTAAALLMLAVTLCASFAGAGR
jgi:hypothetical protein